MPVCVSVVECYAEPVKSSICVQLRRMDEQTQSANDEIRELKERFVRRTLAINIITYSVCVCDLLVSLSLPLSLPSSLYLDPDG